MGFFSSIGRGFKKVGGAISSGASSAFNAAKKVGSKVGANAWNLAKKTSSVVQSVANKLTGGLVGEIGKIVGKVVSFSNDIISKVENVITSSLPYGEYLLPLIEMSQPQLFAYKQLLVKGQTMSDFLTDGSLDVKSLVSNAILSKAPGYTKLASIGEHVGIAKDLQDQIKSTVQEGIGTGNAIASKIKRGQSVVKSFKQAKKGDVSSILSRTLNDSGTGSLPQSLVRDALAGSKLQGSLNKAVKQGNRFLNTPALSKTLKSFSNNADTLRTASQDVASISKGVRQAARNRTKLAKGAGNQLNESVAKLGARGNEQLNRIDSILKTVQQRRSTRRRRR